MLCLHWLAHRGVVCPSKAFCNFADVRLVVEHTWPACTMVLRTRRRRYYVAEFWFVGGGTDDITNPCLTGGFWNIPSQLVPPPPLLCLGEVGAFGMDAVHLCCVGNGGVENVVYSGGVTPSGEKLRLSLTRLLAARDIHHAFLDWMSMPHWHIGSLDRP